MLRASGHRNSSRRPQVGPNVEVSRSAQKRAEVPMPPSSGAADTIFRPPPAESFSVIRLRIVRPLPPGIEGFDLSHLRFGASYDIHQPLSDLLLATGYAVPVDDPSALATASVADDRMPTTRRKAAPNPGKL